MRHSCRWQSTMDYLQYLVKQPERPFYYRPAPLPMTPTGWQQKIPSKTKKKKKAYHKTGNTSKTPLEGHLQYTDDILLNTQRRKKMQPYNNYIKRHMHTKESTRMLGIEQKTMNKLATVLRLTHFLCSICIKLKHLTNACAFSLATAFKNAMHLDSRFCTRPG